MTTIHPIQSSFAAGEVTPKIYSRINTPGHQQGVAFAQNMIADSRGPIFSRPGFQHARRLAGKDCRLFEFDHTRDQSFVVALTDNLITVSSPSTATYGQERLINWDFTNGLAGWSVNEAGGGTVTDNGNGSVTLNPTRSAGGQAMISQTVAFPATSNSFQLRVSGDFRANAPGDLEVRLGTSGPGSGDVYSAALPDGNIFFDVSVPGTLTSPLTLSVEAKGWGVGGNPDTETVLQGVSFREILPAQPVFSTPTPYPEEDLRGIQAEMAPDGLSLMLVHESHPPQELAYNPAGPAWTFLPVVFVSPPAEWVAGSYPGAITYHDGRLWLGGTPNNPEYLWASRPFTFGDTYKDFTSGTNADHAIVRQIAQRGRILWVTSGQDLLIGTDTREFILTAENGVLTPSDANFRRQSSFGSAPVQPVIIGNEVVYVSANGSKLRGQWYQWLESSYLSRDITYTNDHITRTGIRHMAYQKEPDQYIWAALEDGTLTGCTYHRDGNDTPTYGWHRHALHGPVTDVTEIREGSRTYLVAAVQVPLAGVDGVNLMVNSLDEVDFGLVSEELLTPGGKVTGVPAFEVCYLDDYVERVNDTSLVFTGLDHLEGFTVQATVDGNVESPQVVSGGQINLVNSGYLVRVGVPYEAIIVTLPLGEMISEAQATLGKVLSFHQVYVRALMSFPPLINDTRPDDRHTATPMDTREPLRTTDWPVWSLGRDRQALVQIKQDIPVPLNVLAIFGEGSVNHL